MPRIPSSSEDRWQHYQKQQEKQLAALETQAISTTAQSVIDKINSHFDILLRSQAEHRQLGGALEEARNNLILAAANIPENSDINDLLENLDIIFSTSLSAQHVVLEQKVGSVLDSIDHSRIQEACQHMQQLSSQSGAR